MKKLRIFIVELVFVALVVGWLIWKYPELVNSAIPWIVLMIAWHLTYEVVLQSRPVRHGAILTGIRIKRMGWVGAFVVGGLVSVVYWASINKTLFRLAAKSLASSAPKPSETKTEPLSRPQVTPIPAAQPSKKQASVTTIHKPPMKEPLEIVAFDSNGGGLMLHNHSDEPIVVLDMDVGSPSLPFDTSSLRINMEIPPHDVKAYDNKPGIAGHYQHQFGDNWTEHIQQVTQLFPGCLALVYFAANDGGLVMLRDQMAKRGMQLAMSNATGTIHYRRGNGTATESQIFPLVVTTLVATSHPGCENK